MKAWIKAARLPSQSYIALPLLLGQVIAYQQTGHFDWGIFALVQLFGIADQLYIVFANDYADIETDAKNQTSTMFSGGSRVLVDQDISPAALKRAAFLMAGLATLCLTILAVLSAAWILPLGLLGLALLWAYSYPPFKLSYRGGGELLQMLGVGLILPLIGYGAQISGIAEFPWMLLATLLPFNLATGMSTALPDEPSDRESNKRTTAVLWGGLAARGAIIGLYVIGAIAYIWSGGPITHLAVTAISLLALLLLIRSAHPGTKSILGFVFFAILANLGFLISVIWHHSV
jgi:1,4-dihydroxy-2-naphthoate octaprenyltransferase